MTLLLLIPSRLESARIEAPRRPGVEVLTCGIGQLAAGLSTAARLARGDVDRCLLVGIAGTRDPRRIALGALVAGSAVRDQAFGAGHGRSFLNLDEMNLPTGEAPPSLIELESPQVPGALSCVIGSVSAASASQSEAGTWKRRHPDALIEEMEGYAVATACKAAGVPLSILRGISNLAGERDRSTWKMTEAFESLNAGLVAALAAGGR
ncbi:MAG: phosphorylase family protein [Planctomycetota bacterium]